MSIGLRSLVFFCLSLAMCSVSAAGDGSGAPAFAQLATELPSPNMYRSANGEPGPEYWQQQADYRVQVELDETRRRVSGKETITYTNRSPASLRYLWLQLDQNRFADGSMDRLTRTASKKSDGSDRLSFYTLRREQSFADTEHGYEISLVADGSGRPLPHVIQDTMMRVDLPKPLEPGATTRLTIEWAFNIIDEAAIGGRNGYEHFPDSDTYIYFLAQWFPRMAAFTDYTGWQHKPFLGSGEFTLEFGNYDVSITVPDDHLVSATGVLQNPNEVLTAEQRRRLRQARESDSQVFIVTPEEALENEKAGSKGRATWRFKAERVRDFAWSSSRKFIWDAMLHRQEGAKPAEVLAMSFYPNEAEPIWSRYSTQAVVHTMEVYTRFSFPYPYPTAQSVNTWEGGGMEYPMITFNGYRPTTDEASGETTYSRRIKYSLIGVIIHEIGHIYFPMTVNSDERRWTWMDEGINSFLEYLAEVEWEDEFPAYRPYANVHDRIIDYMASDRQVPIMTQSDSVLRLGPNAYDKPTSALVVLRETVMGRELFDFAFREYSRRWKFRRPTPADFFRTMEDASGLDLDWFWRGWFFTTDHLNLAITDIREYQVSSRNPETEKPLQREKFRADIPEHVVQRRNREEGIGTRQERLPGLRDFYSERDQFTISNKDRNSYLKLNETLEPWEWQALQRAVEDDRYIYFVDFRNVGGLVSPLPLTLNYAEGAPESLMIPAEIWRRNAEEVTRMFIRDRRIVSISIDDEHQLPDTDRRNNSFPPLIQYSRLEVYKSESKDRDLMADMLVELKRKHESQASDACDCEVPLAPTNN